jgi:hypothetical protein
MMPSRRWREKDNKKRGLEWMFIHSDLQLWEDFAASIGEKLMTPSWINDAESGEDTMTSWNHNGKL